MPRLLVTFDVDLKHKSDEAPMCEEVRKAFAQIRPKIVTEVKFQLHPEADGTVVIHPTVYTRMLEAYERSQQVLRADPYAARWCLYVTHFGVDSIEVKSRTKENHGGAFVCLFVKRGGLLAQFLSFAQIPESGEKEYYAPPELDKQLGTELRIAFEKIPAAVVEKDDRRVYLKVKEAFLGGMTAYHKHPRE